MRQSMNRAFFVAKTLMIPLNAMKKSALSVIKLVMKLDRALKKTLSNAKNVGI